MTITYPGQSEAQDFVLSDFLQQAPYTVLYFYPKDDTSGCTLEAQGFDQSLQEFTDAHAQIVGVSRDNHLSHTKFCKKYELQFPLVSDDDLTLHMDSRFATWIEKSMYGKKYMGTERATFLLNSSGDVLAERRKVSVPKHVQEVLSQLQSFA